MLCASANVLICVLMFAWLSSTVPRSSVIVSAPFRYQNSQLHLNIALLASVKNEHGYPGDINISEQSDRRSEAELCHLASSENTLSWGAGFIGLTPPLPPTAPLHWLFHETAQLLTPRVERRRSTVEAVCAERGMLLKLKWVQTKGLDYKNLQLHGSGRNRRLWRLSLKKLLDLMPCIYHHSPSTRSGNSG